MIYREIPHCRSCGSGRINKVLDLGMHAISDFVDDPAALERAPLLLVRCEDCTLVQLNHTVDRERLYRTYWYRSSTQEAMVEALRDVVGCATRAAPLVEGAAVLDIGCNDGTLLGCYPAGVRRYGVEPSSHAAEATAKTGATVLRDFYPSPVPGGPFRIITSIAMFYDLDDPNAFVAQIAQDLAADGVWVIQMAYLNEMLRQNAFDNICHEHLEYYALSSLNPLLDRHGLHISQVEYNQVNGGSMRVYVRHGRRPALPDFRTEPAQIARFQQRVATLRTETLRFLELNRGGVLGYGASTKGNTLLQYYGIGPELLPAIGERNLAKVGKLTPTGIPVMSEEELRVQRPRFLFALPWHFIESFCERERLLLEAGTQFVVPLPEMKSVGLEALRDACIPA